MSAARRLPGGRGLATGEQSFRDQGESFEGRRAMLPRQTGPLISTVPGYSLIAVSAYTANRAVLFALPLNEADVVVEQVRLRVTTNSAGQNARTAIYSYNFDSDTFTRVPGTEVTFPTDSTGLLTSSLKRSVRLLATEAYFLAFKASDGVAQFASVASGSGVFNHLYVGESAGGTAPTYKLTQLTRTSIGPVPGAVYVSRRWRDVI